ncbi:Type-2 restriction enzyme NaeI [Streptomyces xanthophaeus]|nr:Type-2 restriction enzyme NaeI [Streptomyces xanthophaeus]
MGTLVEINLQREFGFDDGDRPTDYRIVGIPVDCKFSQKTGGWEMGPEIVDHLCLVVTASDENSTWKAGLVRASEDHLRSARNRDAKRRLNAVGVAAIHWLWPEHGILQENQLLHLDPVKRQAIMDARGRNQRHGQARIFQLFREVQEVIINRTTIETVGHGLDDPLKRVRGAGGARDALRPDGILVLGHQDNDPLVAESLGVPVPEKGQFVAVKVAPAPKRRDGRPVAKIGLTHWVVARDGDRESAAPVVPRGRIDGDS